MIFILTHGLVVHYVCMGFSDLIRNHLVSVLNVYVCVVLVTTTE